MYCARLLAGSASASVCALIYKSIQRCSNGDSNMDKEAYREKKINDQSMCHGFYKSKSKLLWELERKPSNSQLEGVSNDSRRICGWDES